MGIDGRQWVTMAFHGLIKPFQGAEFSDFFPLATGQSEPGLGANSFDASNSAVLCPGNGGFWAFSGSPGRGKLRKKPDGL